MAQSTHPRVPLGKISRMREMLPASLQADIDTLVHSAEFRGLDSLEEQISYLRDNSDISFEMLHILLDMKKSTLYRYYKRYSGENRENPSKQPSPQRYGPNSVLTMDQEMQVIAWIRERQARHDCASPRDVREYAAQIRSQAQGLQHTEGQHLSRDWWHQFKRRHAALIGVKVALNREAARTRIQRADVERYFQEVREALRSIETPAQLLNMDETGFHSRFDRNRRRKCVYHLECPSVVTFSQDAASTTLSLMATITGDGTMLAPVMVCRENVPFNSRELRTIQSRISVTRSPKGYAVESSMITWIEEVLRPYVSCVTAQLTNPESAVYLIMDNCGIHNTQLVREKLMQIPRLQIIWLPPHTSHFLQMLDASVFGQLKSLYRNLRTLDTRPKIEGKILRAFHALWTAAFPRNVLAGFERTGFTYTTDTRGTLTVALNESRVRSLVETNCLESANSDHGINRDGI